MAQTTAPGVILKQPRAGEAHIYRLELNSYSAFRNHYFSWLSPEEKARYVRLRVEQTRDHFLICRGLLKHLCAHYLNADPAQVNFSYNENGKPKMRNERSTCASGKKKMPLQFNLSHSQGTAWFIFATGNQVGIDTEWINRDAPHLEIAKGYFSSQEIQDLENSSNLDRITKFYQYWTLREAFIKAIGGGVNMSSNEIQVLSLSPPRLQSRVFFGHSRLMLEKYKNFQIAFAWLGHGQVSFIQMTDQFDALGF